MAVVYNNNEILVSESDKSLDVNVIYARPEDAIKLKFSIKDVKVTFVNGDVDFIFKNGSVVSLASYSTLAFDDHAPVMYDNSGKIISMQDLLQDIQVYKPEDAILILANRDKYKLVNQDKTVDKIVMATAQSGELDGGNPIAGQGDLAVYTAGAPSQFIDKTGVVDSSYTKDHMGPYMYTSYKTDLFGKTNLDKQNVGNTKSIERPNISYSFLFGDASYLDGSTSIIRNGVTKTADYYAIQFGVGKVTDPKSQLNPVNVDTTNGSNSDKFIDAHSADGNITRTLQIKYGSGVFPQGIQIGGIPSDIKIALQGGGTTGLVGPDANGNYQLVRLDPSGKVNLTFEFPETMAGHTINIRYDVTYFDPTTGQLQVLTTYQDVGIRDVNNASDLNANSTVLSSSVAGVVVNNNSAGDSIIVGGGYTNNIVSTGGNNLIFTGGGNDKVTLGTGDGVIYGSTGYDVINGGSGSNTIVFNNDASYKNLDSAKLKPEYFNTMNSTNGSGFYFGVANPKQVWDNLRLSGYPDGFRDQATADFMTNFNSITLMSNIQTVVGTKNIDTFNLYFQGVNEHMAINGGSATNNIVIVGQDGSSGGNAIIDTGLGTITSTSNAQSSYTYVINTFTTITGGAEADTFKIGFVAGKFSDVTVTYNGTANKAGDLDQYGMPRVWNTADFSGLGLNALGVQASITFDARYKILTYHGVDGKAAGDYFYNINHIIGTKGDDVFKGNSDGAGYIFDGDAGNNTLDYSGSVSGVTYDATGLFTAGNSSQNFGGGFGRVYKIANPNYVYGNLAANHIAYDDFKNIQTIKLSLNNDVIFAGKTAITVDGNGGSNTVNYGAPTAGVDSITVDLSAAVGNSVEVDKKVGANTVKDNFTNVQNFVGTAGDDIFYGGTAQSNSFNGGSGGNNTLNYNKVNIDLNFKLKEGTVLKGSQKDTFSNINNLVGSTGKNIFSIGNFDPLNTDDVTKIGQINIDGGGNSGNKFSFAEAVKYNSGTGKYYLTYNVNDGSAVFHVEGHPDIPVTLHLTRIQSVEGTSGFDHFIAAEKTSYTFSGLAHDAPDTANFMYGDMLDYSSVTVGITLDVKAGTVARVSGGTTYTDNFTSINSFVGGQTDDTFNALYRHGDGAKYYNGYGEAATTFKWDGAAITGTTGGNELSYIKMGNAVTFDLTNHTVLVDSSSGTNIYDRFEHFNTISGGTGLNTYILSPNVVTWDANADSAIAPIVGVNVATSASYITIKPNGSFSNVVSFQMVTTGFNNFDLGSRNISLGTGANSIYYSWADNGTSRVTGYIGTQKSDSFIDKSLTNGYSVDGGGSNYNVGTDDGNKIDFTGMTPTAGSAIQLNLNMTTGKLTKSEVTAAGGKTNGGTDTLTNIDTVILSTGDDTVSYSDSAQMQDVNFKKVDGGTGNNTLDFGNYSPDVTATIEGNTGGHTNGFQIQAGLNTLFDNFQTIRASRGTTTFKVTDDSNGADVTIIGNPQSDKSTLDFSAVSGVTYYNLSREATGDHPVDPTVVAGRATWGTNSATIYSNNITKIKLTAGNDTVYGSNYNHATYDGDAGTNTLRYDWNGFKGGINVDIDSDVHTVTPILTGGKDSYENFSNIIGTLNGNDTFFISNLAKVPAGMSFDGSGGTNTLSFAKDATDDITIDISQTNISIGGQTINVANVSNLVLGQKNNTVQITSVANDFKFSTVDGSKSDNNTITTAVAGQNVIFNQAGAGLLSVGAKSTTLINFKNITVTQNVSGNEFYGALAYNINYTVEGTTAASNNTLSYENSNIPAFVDFTTHTVSKGGTGSNNKDGFKGINTFKGSTGNDTFYIDKAFSNGDQFTTINIDGNAQGAPPTDVISTAKTAGAVILDIANRAIEGSTITYNWTDIGVIEFKKGDAIIDSFNESYSILRSTLAGVNDGTGSSTLRFDITKLKAGTIGDYSNGYVIVDISAHTATKYQNSTTKAGTDTFRFVDSIVGTANNDTFIAGIDNIAFDGNGGTNNILDYKSVGNAVTFNFTYNAALGVTGLTASINKGASGTDTAKNIQTYRGTIYNDNFVLANLTGAPTGFNVNLDGGGGARNAVDLQNLATGNNGIALNTADGSITSSGAGVNTAGYSLTNIQQYKLTNNDDTFYGTLQNLGMFPGVGGKMDVDGLLGNNTADYDTYFEDGSTAPTAANHWNVYLDLESNFVAKDNGLSGANAKGSQDGLANFNTFIVTGHFVDTRVRVGNTALNSAKSTSVTIKTPDAEGKYTVDFSSVTNVHNMDITWNSAGITGKEHNGNNYTFNYVGFTSILLGQGNNILNVAANAPINNNTLIAGGSGANILNFSSISSVTIDASRAAQVKLSNALAAINLKQFYTINIISAQASLYKGGDFNNFNINLGTASNGTVDYSGAVNSGVVLDFTTIAANNVVASVKKSNNTYTDTITNAVNYTLTNADDTVLLKENNTGPTITIDGGKGFNTLSFANYTTTPPDLTFDASSIVVTGYNLANFNYVSLTNNNDTAHFSENSSSQVSGGGGQNTAMFDQGAYTKGVVATEQLNSGKMLISVTKIGSGKSDVLEHFQNFTLVSGQSNTFTAFFVTAPTQPVLDPVAYSGTYKFDFGSLGASLTNTANYKGLGYATAGLKVDITSANANQITTDVQRDKSNNNSIKDTLINANTIYGSKFADDYTVDTNVRGMTINSAGQEGSNSNTLTLNYKAETGVTAFTWDLTTGKISNNLATNNTVLIFNGGINTLTAASGVDNTFNIAKSNDVHNIIGGVGANTHLTAINFAKSTMLGGIFTAKFDGDGNMTGTVSAGSTQFLTFSGISEIDGTAGDDTFNWEFTANAITSSRNYVLNGGTKGTNTLNLTTSLNTNIALSLSAGSVLQYGLNSGKTLTMENFSTVSFQTGKYDLTLDAAIGTSPVATNLNLNIATAATLNSFDISKVNLIANNNITLFIDQSAFSFNYGSANVIGNKVAANYTAATSQDATIIVKQSNANPTAIAFNNFNNIDLSGLTNQGGIVFAVSETTVNGHTMLNGTATMGGGSISTYRFTNDDSNLAKTISVRLPEIANGNTSTVYHVSLANGTFKHNIKLEGTGGGQVDLLNIKTNLTINAAFMAGNQIDLGLSGGGKLQLDDDHLIWAPYQSQYGNTSPAIWTINFNPNYNYLDSTPNTGNTAYAAFAAGTSFIINSNKLTVDLRPMTGVNYGISTGWATGNLGAPSGDWGDSFYFTKNGLLPYLTGTAGIPGDTSVTANVSVTDLNSQVFVDTMIYTNNSSNATLVGLNYDWLNYYKGQMIAHPTNSGVTIDASANSQGLKIVYPNHVNVSGGDGGTLGANPLIEFDISTPGGTYTQYNMKVRGGGTPTDPTTDLKLKFINVQSYTGPDGVSETFNVQSNKAQLNIQGGNQYTDYNSLVAVNTINFTSSFLVAGNISLDISQSSVVTSGTHTLSDGTLGVVTGSIGTTNANLINFDVVDMSKITMNNKMGGLQSVDLRVKYFTNHTTYYLPENNATITPTNNYQTVSKQTLDFTGDAGDIKTVDLTIGTGAHITAKLTAVRNGSDANLVNHQFDVYNAYRIILPSTDASTINQNDNKNSYYIEAPHVGADAASTITYSAGFFTVGNNGTSSTIIDKHNGTTAGSPIGGYDFLSGGMTVNLGLHAVAAFNFKSYGAGVNNTSQDGATTYNLNTTGQVTFNFGDNITKAMDHTVINFSNQMLDNNLSNVSFNVGDDAASKSNYILYQINTGAGSTNSIVDAQGYSHEVGSTVMVLIDKSTHQYMYLTGNADYSYNGHMNGQDVINQKFAGVDHEYYYGSNDKSSHNSVTDTDAIVNKYLNTLPGATGTVYTGKDGNANQQVLGQVTNHAHNETSSANNNVANSNAAESTNGSDHNNNQSNNEDGSSANNVHHLAQSNLYAVNFNEQYSNNHDSNLANNQSDTGNHLHNDLNVLGSDEHDAGEHGVGIHNISLNPSDVLDFSDKGNMDSLSKSVFNSIENNVHHENNNVDHGLQNTIHSLNHMDVSYTHAINSYVPEDSITNHDDPSGKVEDILHKHNSSNSGSDR